MIRTNSSFLNKLGGSVKALPGATTRNVSATGGAQLVQLPNGSVGVQTANGTTTPVADIVETPNVTLVTGADGSAHMFDPSGGYIGDAVSLNGGTQSEFANVFMGQKIPAQTADGQQIIQFNIRNTSGANKIVRIGSLMGFENNAPKYGLAAGAAETAGVTATVGSAAAIASVGPIQIFSLLTCHKPMVLNEVRIISSDGTQLNQTLLVSELSQAFLTGKTTDDQPYNPATTFNMDDTRTNLVVFPFSNLLLEAERWVEVNCVDTISFILELRLSAKHNVAQLVPFGG